MTFSLNADSSAITSALNGFNSSYHSDYFRVRDLARMYLASDSTLANTSTLASDLIKVLINWGAGKRGAPSCQSTSNVASALNDPTLYENLAALEASPPFLEVVSNHRQLKAGGPLLNISDFDKCLIDTLTLISDKFFTGNTNVTYPMKAILLITGLMPAFDSQVRGGLAAAGVTGVNKTRYLIPKLGSVDAKKIYSLPFYISECISRCATTLNSAVSESEYPSLSGEYGRIFDILFFMQNGTPASKSVVCFTPPVGIPWYAI